MRKDYSKPDCTTEQIFESLAAGCTFWSAADDTNCDPDFNGTELRPPYVP